jgi:hypothetical protein
MENLLSITHHEFQLLIGAAGAIGFFAFAGIVYFIDSLTSKNK